MKKSLITAAGVLQFFCLVTGTAVNAIVAALGQRFLPTHSTEIYSIVVALMLAFIVVIEIGSALKIHDSTIHTVFTSVALLLSFIFSYDMQELINPNHSENLTIAAFYVEFFVFHLIMLSHLYLLNFLYKAGISRRMGTFAVWYAVLDFALFAALDTVNLSWLAYIAYIPGAIYFTVQIFTSSIRKKNYDNTFIFTFSILAASLGMYVTTFFHSAGALPYRIYGIDTTYILVINLLYVCVYADFMLRTERQALVASEYKLESERMKTKLLREQVNPHFIFNSLITVKQSYHSSSDLGDQAMGYFSHYLRANVNAMNLDLIPFGEELDNIENYVGLVNIKREKPINIIYNVECDDFKVPVLALQVFVENAVKYARTDEKEDGYISVTSYKSYDGSVVEIADNGVGFDVNNIKETSCGIRNAKERFKLLMGTTATVTSAAGQGTTVKIIIPDDYAAKISGGGISNENYYC